MFCTECGSSLLDAANYCPACGAQFAQGAPLTTPAAPTFNTVDPMTAHDRVGTNPTTVPTMPHGLVTKSRSLVFAGMAILVVTAMATYLINPNLLINSSPVIQGYTDDDLRASLIKTGFLTWPETRQREFEQAINTIAYWYKTTHTGNDGAFYSVLNGRNTNQVLHLAALLSDGRINVDERIALVGGDPQAIPPYAKNGLVSYDVRRGNGARSFFDSSEPDVSSRTQAATLDAAQGYAAAITPAIIGGGICDNLRGLINRTANSTQLPANARIMRIDTFVRNAYQARCILE